MTTLVGPASINEKKFNDDYGGSRASQDLEHQGYTYMPPASSKLPLIFG